MDWIQRLLSNFSRRLKPTLLPFDTYEITLRQLYRSLELPGDNPLKKAHAELDRLVRRSYGMTSQTKTIEFFFALNQELHEREKDGHRVIDPGIPPNGRDLKDLVSPDCIHPTKGGCKQSEQPNGAVCNLSIAIRAF